MKGRVTLIPFLPTGYFDKVLDRFSLRIYSIRYLVLVRFRFLSYLSFHLLSTVTSTTYLDKVESLQIKPFPVSPQLLLMSLKKGRNLKQN